MPWGRPFSRNESRYRHAGNSPPEGGGAPQGWVRRARGLGSHQGLPRQENLLDYDRATVPNNSPRVVWNRRRKSTFKSRRFVGHFSLGPETQQLEFNNRGGVRVGVSTDTA